MDCDTTLDRLRITRELSEKEYKKLLRFEEEHGEQTVEKIAEMFNFKKCSSIK